ncbi:MAG: YcjF family protein [bacterium]
MSAPTTHSGTLSHHADKASQQQQLKKRLEKGQELIRKYAFGSSLTGFIPVPFLDTVGLIGVQRIMLLHLSKLYAVPFSKNAAGIILSSLMGGVASRAAAPFASSALKLLPGVGTAISGTSMATMSAASTYAVGKIFQQHFEQGGTLDNFDLEQAKSELNNKIKEGQQAYSSYKKTKKIKPS